MYGQAALMSRLLQWSCQEQHPMCGLCYSVSDALSSAASGGHVGVATLLLSHPSCTAQAVRNAVCSAACFRQLQVLNILVDGRPDAGNPKLRGSPMSNAAGHGDIAAMEVLVQHGADVNGSKGSPWQEDAEDHPPFRCPLWIAAYHGHVAAVAWLLQQGITAEGSGLGLALRESAKTADATLVRVLLSYSPTQAALPMHGPSVLLTAVRNSHIAVVEELLKAGVPTTTQAFQQMYRKGDVCDLIRNHLPSHEQVPAFLQSAIKHGHMEFAQLLREAMD
jgi:ankyrin repeat protein